MIEILPSAPDTVLVETLSDKALKISWSHSSRNYGSVTHYYVNISALPGFDSLNTGTNKNIAKKGSVIEQDKRFFMQIKVRSTKFQLLIDQSSQVKNISRLGVIILQNQI